MTRTSAIAVALAAATAGLTGCSGSSNGTAADGSQSPGGTASATAQPTQTTRSLRNPTIHSPAPQQSCTGRLGPSQGRPPRALPTLPGVTWDGLDNRNQEYGGWMATADVPTVERKLAQKFRDAGFKVSATTSPSQYSQRFAFQGHKHSGTISAGVLCTGHLKLLYLVDIKAHNPVSATVSPSTSSTP